MLFYRYSRWDGGQQVFPIHEDDLMEQLGDQLMNQGDVSSALKNLMQKGFKSRHGTEVSGVQDLIQRLRTHRQQALDQYNLDSAVGDLKRQLDEVVAAERAGIDRRVSEVKQRYQEAKSSGTATGMEEDLLRRVEDMAYKKRAFLEILPQDLAGRFQKLRDYEFMDQDAKAKFDEVLGGLQRKAVDSMFKGISQRLREMGPQEMGDLKQMMRDLNQMMSEQLRGGQPNFERFMQKWGSLFGPNPPANLDELTDQLRDQMERMDSLYRSLSSEVRQELEDILESVFKDPQLQKEMAQLSATLERLKPSNAGQSFPFGGSDDVSLDEAMQLVQQMQQIEELEKQFRRTHQASNVDELDPELVRDVMGAEASHEVEQLKHMSKLLEEAGYIRRLGNRFELTPKGMRRIGHRALQDIFAYIKRHRAGQHATNETGGGVDAMDDTKQYEFGDPFTLHLQRSLMNAVERRAAVPVRLEAEDFEVLRVKQVSQAATVLMIDLSLSMAMRGNFQAAKKVALALDNLIRTQFPRDLLHIVGFSTYAREVKAEKLPYLTWDEFDPYTNIQHGLTLARKLLARSPGGTRQIIMISDGEPTAHMESGQLFLQYPPSPRTIRETLREVKRCTTTGIAINTFMLERTNYLMEFVDQMTRINRGRVFYTSPEKLGEYILVDYMSSRKKMVG